MITIALALGEVGRPIAAPPGLSPARARFLELALKKSLEDPELLDIIKKQKTEVIYLTAAETKQQALNGAGLSPEMKKRLQDILKQYQAK